MIRNVTFVMVIACCLLISHTGWSASESPKFFYPETLLEKQGLDVQDVVKNQDKFRTNQIHVEWMNHVRSVIPDMNADKEERFIQIHISMLYIKDRINSAYLNGSIDKETFSSRSAELIQWFQRAHQVMLASKEYSSLFGISSRNDVSETIPTGNQLGFPIQNSKTTAEMIEKKFDAQKIATISRFYQEHAQELRDIKKIYETEDVPGVEKEQMKTDMQRIENDLDVAYRNYCRRILTAQEFLMLFGNTSKKQAINLEANR